MYRNLIFKLSGFGLAMGFATISLIPQNLEPPIWLAIFIFCSYQIAKHCAGKFFMHGFMVSLLNSLWITAIHLIFFQAYMEYHPDEITMMAQLPFPYSPRVMMLLSALPFGVVFGIILGLFSFIASKFVKRKNQGNQHNINN